MIRANDPNRKSWVEIKKDSDFSIQNLPFGIFSKQNSTKRIGIALGDFLIDTVALFQLGYLNNLSVNINILEQDFLNPFIQLGKQNTRNFRNHISDLFCTENETLKNNPKHIKKILIPNYDVQLHMPVKIGDYTDFYSSKEHATNVGTMFRDPDNALLPNWLHIPVGYHGRASSIVLSDTPIYRPKGQQKNDNEENPIFGPSKLLDFELEMAFITYQGKPIGENITTDEAEDFIFGMCLFNDWSARDIQKWEYVPLGPFLAKNFASSISPWIVTLDALEPFKVEGPIQNPEPLKYLKFNGNKNYNIDLKVYIQPQNGEENQVCNSNFKYMYWNMCQQLAHHTINGCNINCADIMASGTISGPKRENFGSMLEICWKGITPIILKDGSERKFIKDNDTVIMRGYCENNSYKIGFGEVKNKILPKL